MSCPRSQACCHDHTGKVWWLKKVMETLGREGSPHPRNIPQNETTVDTERDSVSKGGVAEVALWQGEWEWCPKLPVICCRLMAEKVERGKKE